METTQHKLVRGPVILEDIHSSGRCMARINGKYVYLDKGIPGEAVTFTLERRKGFRGGTTTEVSEPSPHRIKPFCRHYDTCGGCPWQHIDYLHQLELKRRILCNALVKYGIKTPEVLGVIASPEIQLYRHRMEYAFSAAACCEGQNSGAHCPSLGFHAPGEPGRVISIRECNLQADPCRAICDFTEGFALDQGMDFFDHETRTGFLRSLSLRVNQKGEIMVLLGISEDRPEQREKLLSGLIHAFPQITSLNYTVHLTSSHGQMQGDIIPFGNMLPFLYETIAGYRFRIHASSFFQPNIRQAEQIFLTARNWAELRGNESVIDLYTGVGTLALFLSPGAAHVTGIEGSPFAVEDAKENARINDIHNTTFLTGDILETFRPRFLEEHGKPNMIVLDPPRAGTLIEIKKTINASGADKVLYLSCNPVSLAFDLKQLTGVYHVMRIQPFDMLPQTQHLETLVMLEK